MRITTYWWCQRCKVFHREGTMIFEEHKRYYKTKQGALKVRKAE